LQLLRRLRERSPGSKLIVLSMYDEFSIVRAAMGAGVNGFVLKRAIATDILDAITWVLRGASYIPHVSTHRRKRFDSAAARISRTEVAMKRSLALSSAIVVMMTIAAPTAYAQQFVYPAKGQNAQQQKKDESECSSWAVKQRGFDPAKPPPPQQAAQPPTTATGTTPGAGVRGAARGAIVGGIFGDAGAGAAAGAAAGSCAKRQAKLGVRTATATDGDTATAGCAGGIPEGSRCVSRRARLFCEVINHF